MTLIQAYENLSSKGFTKGVMELKKRVLEENVANITRSGKHCKPSFLEKDHPGRELGEGSKPTEPKEDKE